MRSTHVENVKSAQKQHKCDWCPEKIEPGDAYTRYRWFGDGGPAVVKMHPECYAAMLECAREDGGEIEFSLHESPRGCSCGGDGYCSHCKKTHNKELRGDEADRPKASLSNAGFGVSAGPDKGD